MSEAAGQSAGQKRAATVQHGSTATPPATAAATPLPAAVHAGPRGGLYVEPGPGQTRKYLGKDSPLLPDLQTLQVFTKSGKLEMEMKYRHIEHGAGAGNHVESFSIHQNGLFCDSVTRDSRVSDARKTQKFNKSTSRRLSPHAKAVGFAALDAALNSLLATDGSLADVPAEVAYESTKSLLVSVLDTWKPGIGKAVGMFEGCAAGNWQRVADGGVSLVLSGLTMAATAGVMSVDSTLFEPAQQNINQGIRVGGENHGEAYTGQQTFQGLEAAVGPLCSAGVGRGAVEYTFEAEHGKLQRMRKVDGLGARASLMTAVGVSAVLGVGHTETRQENYSPDGVHHVQTTVSSAPAFDISARVADRALSAGGQANWLGHKTSHEHQMRVDPAAAAAPAPCTATLNIRLSGGAARTEQRQQTIAHTTQTQETEVVNGLFCSTATSVIEQRRLEENFSAQYCSRDGNTLTTVQRDVHATATDDRGVVKSSSFAGRKVSSSGGNRLSQHVPVGHDRHVAGNFEQTRHEVQRLSTDEAQSRVVKCKPKKSPTSTPSSAAKTHPAFRIREEAEQGHTSQTYQGGRLVSANEESIFSYKQSVQVRQDRSDGYGLHTERTAGAGVRQRELLPNGDVQVTTQAIGTRETTNQETSTERGLFVTNTRCSTRVETGTEVTDHTQTTTRLGQNEQQAVSTPKSSGNRPSGNGGHGHKGSHRNGGIGGGGSGGGGGGSGGAAGDSGGGSAGPSLDPIGCSSTVLEDHSTLPSAPPPVYTFGHATEMEAQRSDNLLFSKTQVQVRDVDQDGNTIDGTFDSSVTFELSVHSQSAIDRAVASMKGDIVQLVINTREGKPSPELIAKHAADALAVEFATSVARGKLEAVFGPNASPHVASTLVSASYALMRGDKKTAAQDVIKGAANATLQSLVGDQLPLSYGRSTTVAQGSLGFGGIKQSVIKSHNVDTALGGGLSVGVHLERERSTRTKGGQTIHRSSRGVGAHASLSFARVSLTCSSGTEVYEPVVRQKGEFTVTKTCQRSIDGQLNLRFNVGNRQSSCNMLPAFKSNTTTWTFIRRTDGSPLHSRAGLPTEELHPDLKARAPGSAKGATSRQTGARTRPSKPSAKPSTKPPSKSSAKPKASAPQPAFKAKKTADTANAEKLQASATGLPFDPHPGAPRGEPTRMVLRPRSGAVGVCSEPSTATTTVTLRPRPVKVSALPVDKVAVNIVKSALKNRRGTRREDIMQTGKKKTISRKLFGAKKHTRTEEWEHVVATETITHSGKTAINSNNVRVDRFKQEQKTTSYRDLRKVEEKKSRWLKKSKHKVRNFSPGQHRDNQQTELHIVEHMEVHSKSDGSDLGTQTGIKKLLDGAVGTRNEHTTTKVTCTTRDCLKGNRVTSKTDEAHGWYETQATLMEVDAAPVDGQKDLQHSLRRDASEVGVFSDHNLRGRSEQVMSKATTTVQQTTRVDGASLENAVQRAENTVSGVTGKVQLATHAQVTVQHVDSDFSGPAKRGVHTRRDASLAVGTFRLDGAAATVSEETVPFEVTALGSGSGLRSSGSRTQIKAKIKAKQVTEKSEHVAGVFEATVAESVSTRLKSHQHAVNMKSKLGPNKALNDVDEAKLKLDAKEHWERTATTLTAEEGAESQYLSLKTIKVSDKHTREKRLARERHVTDVVRECDGKGQKMDKVVEVRHSTQQSGLQVDTNVEQEAGTGWLPSTTTTTVSEFRTYSDVAQWAEQQLHNHSPDGGASTNGEATSTVPKNVGSDEYAPPQEASPHDVPLAKEESVSRPEKDAAAPADAASGSAASGSATAVVHTSDTSHVFQRMTRKETVDRGWISHNRHVQVTEKHLDEAGVVTQEATVTNEETIMLSGGASRCAAAVGSMIGSAVVDVLKTRKMPDSKVSVGDAVQTGVQFGEAFLNGAAMDQISASGALGRGAALAAVATTVAEVTRFRRLQQDQCERRKALADEITGLEQQLSNIRNTKEAKRRAQQQQQQQQQQQDNGDGGKADSGKAKRKRSDTATTPSSNQEKKRAVSSGNRGRSGPKQTPKTSSSDQQDADAFAEATASQDAPAPEAQSRGKRKCKDTSPTAAATKRVTTNTRTAAAAAVSPLAGEQSEPQGQRPAHAKKRKAATPPACSTSAGKKKRADGKGKKRKQAAAFAQAASPSGSGARGHKRARSTATGRRDAVPDSEGKVEDEDEGKGGEEREDEEEAAVWQELKNKKAIQHGQLELEKKERRHRVAASVTNVVNNTAVIGGMARPGLAGAALGVVTCATVARELLVNDPADRRSTGQRVLDTGMAVAQASSAVLPQVVGATAVSGATMASLVDCAITTVGAVQRCRQTGDTFSACKEVGESVAGAVASTCTVAATSAALSTIAATSTAAALGCAVAPFVVAPIVAYGVKRAVGCLFNWCKNWWNGGSEQFAPSASSAPSEQSEASRLKELCKTYGLSEDCNKDQVQTTYRRKAKEYHPNNGRQEEDAHDKFIQLKADFDEIHELREKLQRPIMSMDKWHKFSSGVVENLKGICKKAKTAVSTALAKSTSMFAGSSGREDTCNTTAGTTSGASPTTPNPSSALVSSQPTKKK